MAKITGFSFYSDGWLPHGDCLFHYSFCIHYLAFCYKEEFSLLMCLYECGLVDFCLVCRLWSIIVISYLDAQTVHGGRSSASVPFCCVPVMQTLFLAR